MAQYANEKPVSLNDHTPVNNSELVYSIDFEENLLHSYQKACIKPYTLVKKGAVTEVRRA